MEAIDPHTVRLYTSAPFPLAPGYLSAIGIVSRRHGEAASTADYNSGKAAIGTGPFWFVAFTCGDRIVLEHNPTYWGRPPTWDRVELHFIRNQASRLAALLAGDAALINQVSVQDVARQGGPPLHRRVRRVG